MDFIIKEALRATIPSPSSIDGGKCINGEDKSLTDNGEDSNSKVLIIGHSWVQEMEECHQNEDFGRGVEVVYAAYPGAHLDTIIRKLPQHLDSSFSHVVILILLTHVYTKIDLAEGQGEKSYDVIEKDPNFDLHCFIRNFDQFVTDCRDRCPGVLVTLLIPPPVDPVCYNERLVKYYPSFIRNRYYDNPRFAARLLHQQALEIHELLDQIKKPQNLWTQKEIYPVKFAITRRTSHRKNMRRFLNGEVLTLGHDSYLWDGLHPSHDLIHSLLQRMKISKCFERSTIIPTETFFSNTAPYMDLDVSQPMMVNQNEGPSHGNSMDIQSLPETSKHPPISSEEGTSDLTPRVLKRVYQRLGQSQGSYTPNTNLLKMPSTSTIEHTRLMTPGVREPHTKRIKKVVEEEITVIPDEVVERTMRDPEKEPSKIEKRLMVVVEEIIDTEIVMEVRRQIEKLKDYMSGFMVSKGSPHTPEEITCLIRRYLD